MPANWTQAAGRLSDGAVLLEHDVPLSLSRRGNEAEIEKQPRQAGCRGRLIVLADEDGGNCPCLASDAQQLTPQAARQIALATANELRERP